MDKITIGIDGDTSQIEKKLSELQKKINSFRTGGSMDVINKISSGGKANTDRMRQSQAEIFKRTQSQIDSELSKQLNKYKSITGELDSQVTSKERLLKLQSKAGYLNNIEEGKNAKKSKPKKRQR